LEAVGAAVVLDVAEDGLDHPLASGVARVAVLGGEHSSHEAVDPADAPRSWFAALARVGRNERRIPSPISASMCPVFQ
jgi:hypothetical protein